MTTTASTTTPPARLGRAPALARLRFAPATRAVGATLEGVDLRGAADADIEALRRAVAVHRVVFVRGQVLAEDDLRALAARFGPVARSPVHELVGSDRTTSVIEDDAARPPAGFDWHTDLSWTQTPPALGFLHALEIPPYGGDTIWASQVAALDSLPHALREQITSMQAEHRPDATLLASVERHHGPAAAIALRRAHPPVVHPLVRTLPETGERALFLSPLYARRIVGLDHWCGDRILRTLDRTLDDPHHQVRWRWQPGDLAIWDETSTCHRALTDHFPQRRVMRRCVVEGARPQP